LLGPYFFVTCNLIQPPVTVLPQPSSASLLGTTVSSLHRLKDSNNHEGAFFVFGDLSAKAEGTFALQFNLYEVRSNQAFHIQSIVSDKFPVHGPKFFPGLNESTQLTRSFSDQGVRLRVRKEPRTLLRKRGPAYQDYVPRRYKRDRHQQEKSEEQIESSVDSPLSSRHSQAEQQGSIQSPLESPQGQQIGYFAASSQQATLLYGPYPDDHDVKRPRTGSEHGRFGHPSQQSAVYGHSMAAFGPERPALPVTPPEFPDHEHWNMISDYQQSYGSYPQQSPQHVYGGDPYSQSPTALREGYFQPFNPQQEIPPQGYHQSPTTQIVPQPHAQYRQVPAYADQGVHTPYSSMDDGSRPPGTGETGMGAPQFARGYGPLMHDQGERRGSYIIPIPAQQGFSSLNQNLSAGMRVSSTRSSNIPITTGAGPMDTQYQ
jgi:hypothetical protein